MRIISTLISVVLLLVACGTRGPLTLPPKGAELSPQLSPNPHDHNSTPSEPSQ